MPSVKTLAERMGLSFETPPPRLVVIYDQTEVAELTRQEGQFIFRYLPTFEQKNLAPIPSFPDLKREYRSTELWQFFRERIPDLRRPEIREWIEVHDIQEDDEFQLLEKLGSRAVTDPFQLKRVA